MIDDWLNDYIFNVQIDTIEWLCLDYLEFKEFILNNYFDLNYRKYVTDRVSNTSFITPIGMHYLYYSNFNNDYKYILGIAKNTRNKKTIISCITYLDTVYLFEEQDTPITYINSVEVNFYFRNKGFFKKMSKKIIDFIPDNQKVIVSKQSTLGKKCNVFLTIKDDLIKKGFNEDIWCDDYLNVNELKEKLCFNKKLLKRKK